MRNAKEMEAFSKKLNAIALNKDPATSLEKAVAIEALIHETQDAIESFFEDLLKHGCSSGMVGSLIYYCDTDKFFDEHYHQIMELKTNYEEATGQPMNIPYHLKNHLAWFGFEETARKLWEEE